VGSTSTGQTVTLTNPGPLSLQISHIATTGDFAETNNCGNVIGPNGSCTVTVTFTPSASGNRNGTLTITDNASGSPQTVSLSGTGGNASLGLGMATGSSSSATFNAGSNVTFTLSIGGQGVAGTASLTCTGAPAAATCTAPATTSVSATTASTFNAVVTTTARTQAALHPDAFWGATWAWGFALIGCLFFTTVPSQRSRIGYFGLLALFALALSSCGGGSSNPQSGGATVGTPAGTYNLVVTATSGSTTQTQNLILIVQ
jgi:Abnormal spindle-like microcephaly-assoc'd, ASPM-SPD-2-Hydin